MNFEFVCIVYDGDSVSDDESREPTTAVVSGVNSSNDRRRLNSAMAVRRWFLILTAPAILLLTLAAVAQWRVFWQWFIR